MKRRPMPPASWLLRGDRGCDGRATDAERILATLKGESVARAAALKASAVVRASAPVAARRPTDSTPTRHRSRLERLDAGDDAGRETERLPINQSSDAA